MNRNFVLTFITLLLIHFTACQSLVVPSLVGEEVIEAISRLNITTDGRITLPQSFNAKALLEIDEDDPLVQACKSEQWEAVDCVSGETSDNGCEILKSDYCQKLFNDPASVFPSCAKYNESFAEEVYALYIYLGRSYAFACTNHGKCKIVTEMVDRALKYDYLPDPNSVEYFTAFMQPSEEALQENCKSKACTDNAVATYDSFIHLLEVDMDLRKKYDEEIIENYEEKKEIMESNVQRLRADTCVELNGMEKDSAATNLISRRTFIISVVSLVLLYLW